MLEKWRSIMHKSIIENGLTYVDINSYTCVVMDQGKPTGVFKFYEEDGSYSLDSELGTEFFIPKE